MTTLLQAVKAIGTLKVSSPAFRDKGSIPEKYTCDGDNVNPPLSITNIPKQAQTLAVIVDDPDAPVRTWTHWMIWNIIPANHIRENDSPGVQGINDFRVIRYSGPCPPTGVHRYHFKVYALDSVLSLPAGSAKHELEKEMASHVLAFGELVGTYHKK